MGLGLELGFGVRVRVRVRVRLGATVRLGAKFRLGVSWGRLGEHAGRPVCAVRSRLHAAHESRSTGLAAVQRDGQLVDEGRHAVELEHAAEVALRPVVGCALLRVVFADGGWARRRRVRRLDGLGAQEVDLVRVRVRVSRSLDEET